MYGISKEMSHFVFRNPNTPVPIPQSISWPEFDTTTQQYLHITANRTDTGSHVFGKRTEFWLNLLPELAKVTNFSQH